MSEDSSNTHPKPALKTTIVVDVQHCTPAEAIVALQESIMRAGPNTTHIRAQGVGDMREEFTKWSAGWGCEATYEEMPCGLLNGEITIAQFATDDPRPHRAPSTRIIVDSDSRSRLTRACFAAHAAVLQGDITELILRSQAVLALIDTPEAPVTPISTSFRRPPVCEAVPSSSKRKSRRRDSGQIAVASLAVHKSLELLTAVSESGVRLSVCARSLSEYGIPLDNLDLAIRQVDVDTLLADPVAVASLRQM